MSRHTYTLCDGCDKGLSNNITDRIKRNVKLKSVIQQVFNVGLDYCDTCIIATLETAIRSSHERKTNDSGS